MTKYPLVRRSVFAKAEDLPAEFAPHDPVPGAKVPQSRDRSRPTIARRNLRNIQYPPPNAQISRKSGDGSWGTLPLRVKIDFTAEDTELNVAGVSRSTPFLSGSSATSSVAGGTNWVVRDSALFLLPAEPVGLDAGMRGIQFIGAPKGIASPIHVRL